MCYRLTDRLDSSEFFYRQSVKIKPKKLTALANLALVLILKNELDKAEEIYNRILKTDPKDPDGYFGLAEIMLRTGRYELASSNAMKAYERWKITNPSYAGDALFYAGLGYLLNGDPGNSKKYFEKAMKLGTKIPDEYLEKAGMKKNEK